MSAIRKPHIVIGVFGVLLLVLSLAPIFQGFSSMPIYKLEGSSRAIDRGVINGYQYETFSGGMVIHIKPAPIICFISGIGLIAYAWILRKSKPAA